MRQILLIAAFVLSVAAPSLAQEQLKVGNTYQNSAKVFTENGGMYVALPEGMWTLVSYEEWRTQPNNSPMRGGVFTSLDGRKLRSVIEFRAGMSDTRGWVVDSFCSRKDIHFRFPEDARENRSGRQTRCWGINHHRMTLGSKPNKYLVDAFEWAKQHTEGIPGNMIVVEYHRASGSPYLMTRYFHNPELEGFAPSQEIAWSSSEWHKDLAAFDPKKVAYLEQLKNWGAHWLPTFEAAFAGRLK